jgi:hypothetical protein
LRAALYKHFNEKKLEVEVQEHVFYILWLIFIAEQHQQAIQGRSKNKLQEGKKNRPGGVRERPVLVDRRWHVRQHACLR